MIQENEIVMLILGIGVLIFIHINRSKLKRIPSLKMLVLGFYMLLAGWAMTVMESFFWGVLLNYLEHIFYTIGSFFVAAWCWKVFRSSKEVM